MNRLIIIGNGFDLAHGLKTSYRDFLTDYLNRALKTFSITGNYDDALISIAHRYTGTRKVITLGADISPYNLLDEISKDKNYFTFEYKSYLLKNSLSKSRTLRWVDLENEYFDNLIESVKKSPIDFSAVKTLNYQFQYIKSELEKYLLGQQVDLEQFVPDPNINGIFTERLDLSEILIKSTSFNRVENILYLNFNYTNTLKNYLSDEVNLPINEDVIHIHGELNNPKNEIVFGFGDEYDEDYLKFESLKNNEVFKHIKSFAYFKTKNYDELIRFVDAENYQVFIIGHSCGLSDRTMFREIFEHSNCVSIKIFYHQIDAENDDFTDKTFEIARHFTNKNLMRKKIAKKPNSSAFPQYNIKNTI